MSEEKIELWHVIDGRYVHIAQVVKDGKRIYYTDGKQEEPVKLTNRSG